MGWTRHFYELEGVVETFLATAGAQKDPARKTKLAFWAYELWLSEERGVLWDCLRRAWWRHGEPDASIEAALLGCVSEEAVILQILGSLQSVRPLPAPFPAPRGATGLPWSEWPAEAKEVLRKAVRDAVGRGRMERVLRLLGALPLPVAAEQLGIPYKKGVGLLHMLGALGDMRLRRGGVVAAAAKWPQIPVGRVGARLFCTKGDGGAMEPSGFGVMDGCAFWKTRLAERGCDADESRKRRRLVFATEDDFEAFYEEFFPDDIPDEWTAEEREKSHKGGVLANEG